MRGGRAADFAEFSKTADEHPPITLKDLLKLRFPENGVPLEAVEPPLAHDLRAETVAVAIRRDLGSRQGFGHARHIGGGGFPEDSQRQV